MIRALGFLLRIYSYIFHLALSAFLIGVASVSAISRQPLNLRMLPFDDETMLRGVFVLGTVGLLATLLAVTGIFRYLFPVWAAVVVYLSVRGYLFGTYTFPNAQAFKDALWLIVGAFAAFWGALSVVKRRRALWWF